MTVDDELYLPSCYIVRDKIYGCKYGYSRDVYWVMFVQEFAAQGLKIC